MRTGDVIRLQPNYLSFISLQAIEDIYGTNTEASKSDMYSTFGSENGFRPSIAMETYLPSRNCRSDSRDKTRHAFLRRVMNPCFSPAALRELEPTMNIYYQQFLEGLQERANKNGGDVEMTEWFHNLSFDVYFPKAPMLISRLRER